jgi:MFS family permease
MFARGVADQAEEPTEPPRRPLILAFAAGLLGFGALWLVATVSAGFACGGDGGSPYAARDSTVGTLCQARSGWLASAVWVLLALAPIVLAVVGGVVAVVRRDWKWLGLTGAGALVLLAFVTLPFLALPSTCSDADQQRYDAWVAHRSGGKPADCDHY